eukprot:TRINITY_DN1210_c0_g1_i3.p1 TRINITY_DN1210_c0_g1~~TRINITY_DN1210_c0_g1_i3.p1  ORF type:complete len:505 (-),score=74.18 TRINITY_DN1210_c0_g1_i3:86-1600(-)
MKVKTFAENHKAPIICKSLDTCCPGLSEDDLHYHQIEHSSNNSVHSNKIANSILDVIGNTPLVRLNKIPQSMGLKCEVLVKCEYLNPGGSMKDRTALKMIQMAEENNQIQPHQSTLCEPTSGNTGISLALIASLKGYNMMIGIPEKMSREKVDLMKCLGAEVIQTPTGLPPSDPESNFGVCESREQEGKGIMLDQFKNPANPLIHYEQTAEELLDQCDGKIDYLFSGAGTGGTISGISKKLKERGNNCVVVGCDPIGSLYTDPSHPEKVDMTFQVEGVGYNFIPKTLDHKLIDQWRQYNDEQAFLMCRRMIKEEGILCGGSSGGNMYCALQMAKERGLDQRHRLVVVIHDSVRNYMSKFLSEEWMVEQGFMEWKKTGNKVSVNGLEEVSVIGADSKVSDVIEKLKQAKGDQLLVRNQENNEIIGIIKTASVLKEMAREKKKITRDGPINRLIQKKFIKVKEESAEIELLQMLLERNGEVVIEKEDGKFVSMGQKDLMKQASGCL